ncbi:TPA: hypothetical protein U1265_000627 [Streptococcus suis]|nr:hypothetical protein [Streptococcus suis]HEM5108292.1 hypothetical protein [Streptococcus suis]HEM5115280.1 hypothetical protein [Streptococcus suis]HEM5134879.1 hypothetical protein [Streptococcus suis]
MVQLLLGDVFSSILETSKEQKITSGWLTQEYVVNTIYQYFQLKKNINGEEVDYYVSAPSCSLYFQSKKTLPPWYRNAILSSNMDELFLSITAKFENNHTLPLKAIVKKLRKIYLHENFQQTQIFENVKTNRNFFNINELEIWNKKKQYSYILTAILFHCLLFIPNDRYCKYYEHDIASLHFNEDVGELVTNGQYYNYFEKDISIRPSIEDRTYRILTKRKYESPFPNPEYFDKNTYYINFYFATEELCNQHSITSLIINGKDYTENKLETISDLSDQFYPFPIRKAILIENIPKAPLYTVNLDTEYAAAFPIRYESYKLTSPTKRLKVSVSIFSREKRKLSLSLKTFGDFNSRIKPIERIEPNTTMAYFEFLDWTMPGSGYSYLVKPWGPFWKEFIPNID